MTEPTDPTHENPTPLGGVLQPGERTTRRFSAPLGGDVVPVLQRVPYSGVRIAEQSAEDITLENTGDTMSPYLVLFVPKDLIHAVAAGRELIGSLSRLSGRKK